MPERKIDKLDELFPRFSAERLPSRKKLEELRYKLEHTPQWSLYSHVSDEVKTIKLGLSNLTEKAIPWIHHILKDGESEYEMPAKTNFDNQSSSIFGISLHEALSLFDLIRNWKQADYEIDSSFPTHKRDLIEPFIKVLKNTNRSIADIWREFHKLPELADHTKYILSSDFGELPLSLKKQEELEIRGSEKVFEAGIKLFEATNKIPASINEYYELLAIFNFQKLSKNGSRIQIPVRYDKLSAVKVNKNNFVYNFFDLKTGKYKPDSQMNFQALLMNFLSQHFVNLFCVNSELKNRSRAFMSYPIDNLYTENKNAHFDYGYFDQNTREILKVPVLVDYTSESGQLFMDWLSFYADAFCAFKSELNRYLREINEFNGEKLIYYQTEMAL